MATISTHNGSAVRQNHNIRTRSCVEKEIHIDPNGIHEVWLHETINHAYHRLFDDAVKRYNNKQPREDRKIRNYLSDIQKDAKKHPCYEMIIGIYGKEVSDEQGKDIMREFVSTWHERNPNLQMIGAYYHADEQGKNPHVHIDYIPIAHGYSRGMDVQTGLVKAFKEQGIVKHGKSTAQMLWEKRENLVLENYCRERGIIVEHPQSGKNVEHLHTENYKAQQQAKTLEKQLNRLEESISHAQDQKRDALRERDAVRADVDVKKAVEQATEPFRRAKIHVPEILSETEAKPKSFFSEEKPATVTILREDYEQIVKKVYRLEQTAELARQSAERMEQQTIIAKEAAAVLKQNKIDSYEVAVDSKVRELNKVLDKSQQELQMALRNAENMKETLALMKRELRHMNDVKAFFPQEWDQMVERTKLAREIEELYYKAQDNVSDDRIRLSFGTTYFELSDGREMDFRGLLTAYEETCEANDIPHEGDMIEHLNLLRDRDYDWER